MPIKWTPEKDQLLLLRILETHDLKVDPKKVVAAWPTISGQEKPTPRAITERLVRMRQIVKSTSDKDSDGHFSIGSGASSSVSTPRKSTKSSSAVPTPESGKRKRLDTSKSAPNSPLKNEMDVDEGHDEVYEVDDGFVKAGTPAKKGSELFDIPAFSPASTLEIHSGHVQAGSSLGLKQENQVPSDGSPVKRNRTRDRRATTQLGMVNYEDLLGDDEDSVGGRDDDVESSASDYVPGGAEIEDDDYA
ncbi:hypothetical protein BDW62DRAFT_203388 [Aspergillus aurantiobrunneus]